jgi:sec-independent protein translocase protein TatB
MLDIGFSELLLIAVVALVVIGPKDLPVVIRHVMKILRELRDIYGGLKRQMHEMVEESGLDDLKQEMTTIIDLEGKPQKAYNVADLDALRAPATSSKVMPVLPPAVVTEEK